MKLCANNIFYWLIVVSVEGCKFVQLKPLNAEEAEEQRHVSVEGCKFVQLKPSANAMKFINFILC